MLADHLLEYYLTSSINMLTSYTYYYCASVLDAGLCNALFGRQVVLILKVIRPSTEIVIWFTRLTSQHSRKLTVFITDVLELATAYQVPFA